MTRQTKHDSICACYAYSRTLSLSINTDFSVGRYTVIIKKKILPSVRVDFVKGWRHSRNDGGMGGIFETREGGGGLIDEIRYPIFLVIFNLNDCN